MADLALDALPGLLERMTSVLRRLPTPGGLSLATAATLNTLDRYGPARLTDLARSEAVTQPGMTQLIARLERDGYAERRGDPEDGRAVLVAITAAGQALVERRRASRRGQLDVLVGELDDAERQRLAEALPALARLADLGERARRENAAVPA